MVSMHDTWVLEFRTLGIASTFNEWFFDAFPFVTTILSSQLIRRLLFVQTCFGVGILLERKTHKFPQNYFSVCWYIATTTTTSWQCSCQQAQVLLLLWRECSTNHKDHLTVCKECATKALQLSLTNARVGRDLR